MCVHDNSFKKPGLINKDLNILLENQIMADLTRKHQQSAVISDTNGFVENAF